MNISPGGGSKPFPRFLSVSGLRFAALRAAVPTWRSALQAVPALFSVG